MLVENEGYLISKHRKEDKIVTQFCWFFLHLSPTMILDSHVNLRLESRENCTVALECKKLLVTGNSPGRTALQLLLTHMSKAERISFPVHKHPSGKGQIYQRLSYWEMAMQMMLMTTPESQCPEMKN